MLHAFVDSCCRFVIMKKRGKYLKALECGFPPVWGDLSSAIIYDTYLRACNDLKILKVRKCRAQLWEVEVDVAKKIS